MLYACFGLTTGSFALASRLSLLISHACAARRTARWFPSRTTSSSPRSFSHWRCAFLIKRNVITIFMSIELMLNAVNLTFVAFAHMWHRIEGQIFVFFVMVVAAAEAAVGLAIIIALFRARQTLNVDQVNLMKN